MIKESNIFLLPTTKTEIHNEFKELTPLVREKIMDIVLGIEITKIEKAVFYVLENAEDIKKTVLGF